eukprot:gb/GECG01011379.1/.p1 GENE.gb/GECG01011379.1/~~gb/GECG01011379.1/.p1  ORF type:complete len:165 (+),score=30.79 gb/GECG01011379.1/:1-495(+)
MAAAGETQTAAVQQRPGLSLDDDITAIPEWFIPAKCKVKAEVEGEIFSNIFVDCLGQGNLVRPEDIKKVQECLCQKKGNMELTGFQRTQLASGLFVGCFLLSDKVARDKYEANTLWSVYPPDDMGIMQKTVIEWMKKADAHELLELTKGQEAKVSRLLSESWQA